jgi:hypothetical protein
VEFENAIAELESFWEPDKGVFWQLRQGNFVESELRRFLAWIGRLQVEEEVALPRRLVAMLWYLPLFMQWQTDRVRTAGGDLAAYSRAITEVTNELERILGVP